MAGLEEHELLKSIGKEILKSKGFDDKQIFTEFPVIQAGQVIERHLGYGQEPVIIVVRKGIIADTIGVSPNRSVAIECGNTPSDRLSQLKLFFDEVLYLPYVRTSGSEKEILELNSQVSELRKENDYLKQENAHYRRRLEDLEAKIRDALHT